MNNIFFVLFLLILHEGFAQEKTDKKLHHKIESMIQGFNGEIGVYIKNLRNKKIVAINSDSIFPTASMIKVPIMIGVMKKIESGELNYGQELVYKDSLLYAGVDILGSFKHEEKIELGKVMMLMLTMSDNTGSLWLQSMAGGGLRINQLLDSLGFKNTRVNSRTPGREEFRSLYGWGQTTPREMATLLEKIYYKRIFNERYSNDAMRMLSRNYWNEHAISQIPPTVAVFSKNGAVNESRSEVLLVNAVHNPYLLCICTKNNKDESWNNNNEAWQLTRKISALVWNYFHPKSNSGLQ